MREDVRKAKVVICECTFTEPDQKQRAEVGKHMHAEAISEWLDVLESDALVLIHLSRRTNMAASRKSLAEILGHEKMERVHILMDHRTNRERFERQVEEVGRDVEQS